MDRREIIRSMLASGAVLLAARNARAQDAVAHVTRGMAMPKIKDITVINTSPEGSRLTVVKVTTDQPGLYGYGCATFTQRADLIKPAVELYLKPLLVGKPADRIEDTWQMCYDSSYWKNGPVENNAISGVDQALWDIKGRMAEHAGLSAAGRQGARGGRHSMAMPKAPRSPKPSKAPRSSSPRASAMSASRWACPAWPAMAPADGGKRIPSLHDAPVFEREAAKRRALALFEAARKELGDGDRTDPRRP